MSSIIIRPTSEQRVIFADEIFFNNIPSLLIHRIFYAHMFTVLMIYILVDVFDEIVGGFDILESMKNMLYKFFNEDNRFQIY